MRAALVTAAMAAGALAMAPAAPAQTIGPARIAKAVSQAERSRSLWATINICDSRQDPNALGVRGQMPTLGFKAGMTIQVQVDFWSASRRRFVPIQSPSARTTLSLGSPASGLQQDGAVFPFKDRTGLLNATITFIWKHAGKIIGETRRRTTAGHHDADFGSPPHYSAAQCRI